MRKLVFDGYWTGDILYYCDCNGCTEHQMFPFANEEEAKNYAAEREKLKKDCGWEFTRINSQWRDFCSEACRNKYIRENTL